jgi:intracellular sulfur oxidation DsrE/DsrF family protein
MQSKVINLKKQGIHFNVCANTLKGKKINYKNDMYDVSEQDIVPSGVAEIAALQAKGYSYVKP